MTKFTFTHNLTDNGGVKKIPVDIEVLDYEAGVWYAFVEIDGEYYDISDRLTQREVDDIDADICSERIDRLTGLRYQFEEHV